MWVKHIRVVAVIMGLIWACFLLSRLLPINQFGVLPRSIDGLLGIISMPLLHLNFGHLLANTVPLLFLLSLMVISRPNPWRTVIALTLISGAVIWLLARPMIHIGASGLIYAMMGYLIVIGLIERRLISLAIALAVGAIYGSVILAGIVPGVPGVSWESHLIGLIAGGGLARLSDRKAKARETIAL